MKNFVCRTEEESEAPSCQQTCSKHVSLDNHTCVTNLMCVCIGQRIATMTPRGNPTRISLRRVRTLPREILLKRRESRQKIVAAAAAPDAVMSRVSHLSMTSCMRWTHNWRKLRCEVLHDHVCANCVSKRAFYERCQRAKCGIVIF